MNISVQLSVKQSNDSNQLQQIAHQIRDLSQSASIAVIQIGRGLTEAKSIADRGTFVRWIRAECGFTPRSAQNYMRVAAFADAKSETVSLLSLGALYLLSAKGTPPEIVRTVLWGLETGHVFSEAEIQDMLALHSTTLAPSLDACEPASSDKAADLAAKLLRQIDPALAHALVEGPWNLVGKRLRQHLLRGAKPDEAHETSGHNSDQKQPVDLARDPHDDRFRPRVIDSACMPTPGTDNHASTKIEQPPAQSSIDQALAAGLDAKANDFNDGNSEFLCRSDPAAAHL